MLPSESRLRRICFVLLVSYLEEELKLYNKSSNPQSEEVVVGQSIRQRRVLTIMASTDGLVPITRSFLSSYYDKYPFEPLSDDVARLTSEIRSIIRELQQRSPLNQGYYYLFFFFKFLSPVD